jgi:DNA-binding CsgD family transcriptional regulator/tetratricopeptide (TPR) repeat protein
MLLLERDPFLSELDAARACAAAGHGCAVLVSGEAGIGKTLLVERFVARVQARDSRTRTLWGACDALFTPRPLGPLLDMARQAQGALRELTRSGVDRERLFLGVLDELAHASLRTLAVFEDLHWADEATLDLLKFLVRRIGTTHSLLVLTFRDDEVDAAHPLRRLLGDLPAGSTRRLKLPPLSELAVARLATAAGRRAEDLHTITGGNPFYVTEVLATDEGGIPASVRDAVLARAARLAPAATAVLDVVSVVPGPTERWLLDSLLDDPTRAVQEGVRAGILRATRAAVAFRHELARRAWEDSHEPGYAAELHARVLRALKGYNGGTTMLPRLVHHADRAGDAATVLRLAPVAARDAAALGAHREAAAHYGSALRYADGSAPAERAALLDAWSYEVHLSGRIGDAVRAREEALDLWRRIGDRRRQGDALRLLSRLAWFEGRREDAATCAAEAIRVLEPLGPSHELAMAYSTRAQLHILAEERQLAPEWGDRAVSMAEALDDPEALVHALTNAACLEPGGSREQQVRAVRLAQQHGLHEHAMRAFTWLVSDAIMEQDYALAGGYLAEALEYAEARDMDAFAFYLRGWRSRMRAEQGQLEEAEADAADVVRHEDNSTVVRLPALTALGAVRTRVGDPGAQEILDEALDLALSTGELQRIAPVANARAEAAWLRGDLEGVRSEAMRAYTLALQAESRWDVGRLAAWLRRAGALDEPPADPPGPFAAELAGRWREAADAWHQLGCPYERALALAEGDEAAQRASLAILDELGARPAAALVRSRLLRSGARGVPCVRRGPSRSTRANPAGLTNRQMDVLALLAAGHSNREIGRRLFLSTRTVDHHVSALLRKLNAGTRARAALLARDMALVPTSASQNAALPGSMASPSVRAALP